MSNRRSSSPVNPSKPKRVGIANSKLDIVPPIILCHCEARRAVAIPWTFRKPLGIATPVCPLVRDDSYLVTE